MQPTYEILDSSTAWNKRGKRPVMRFGKTGIISFSIEAVHLLSLKPGMRISFLLHKEDKGIIYFYQHKDGVPLLVGNATKSGTRLHVCGREIAKKCMTFFGFTDNKTFDITEEKISINGVDAWFIQKKGLHKPIKWRKE